MRSNALFYAVCAVNFVINTALHEYQISALQSVIGILFYICTPVLLSVGSLRTRIVRSSLIYFVMMIAEVASIAVYMLLVGDMVLLDHIGPDNISMVIVVYVVMLPIVAIPLEMIANHYARVDEDVNASSLFEIPVIGLLLTSLLSFSVSYIRLFKLGGEVLRPYTALSAFFFSWVSLLVIYLVYSSARREAEVRRETAENMLALRKARHTRQEVDAMARRAEGMRSLRHDLANQMRVISSLTESGDATEASQRLSVLQARTRVLKGAEQG